MAERRAAPDVPRLPLPPGTRLHRGLAARAVDRMIHRDLRRAFARVEWVGPWPDVPADRPVVFLSTHHTFYDGYVGHLVARRVFGRHVVLWMAEWDRFPFFGALGALPFPDDAPSERAATMRRTVRLLRSPAWAFQYFPEAVLHPADEGIAPFAAGALLDRLGRMLPPATWLPLALHVVFEDDAHPVLRVAAGAPADALPADAHARLAATFDALRTRQLGPAWTLLEGAGGPASRWDFTRFAPRFRRRLADDDRRAGVT